MGLRARSAPTCFLLLFFGCAASSGSLPRVVQVEEGRRVRVLLTDSASRVFAVQNRSSGSRSEIYSDRGATAQPKVVPDSDLQTLLDVLAKHGLFAHAAPVMARGARATITVETPDRTWHWSRPAVDPTLPPNEQPQVLAFEEARNYVMLVYNSEMSFHAGSIESFSPETRKKLEEARQSGGSPAKRTDK